MYANYLVDVGKLVFVVGEVQSTSQFKKLFQGNDSLKDKIFYKCVDEVPVDTYKKVKYDTIKKGIIRTDWFTKILDKAPQMIVMIFNFTPQLSQNEVWEDRLKTTIKKINKVFDILKTNNKEEIILRIIVLISKHTFGGINLHEKITNFLKTYEKDLFIIQSEMYAKQISKIRGNWIANLEKNYDRKFKKIAKKSQQTFLERRYGCLIKMAIIAQMLNKKDQKQKYQDAYIALRNRFTELTKSVNILNHNQIRELRTVSDIVILRYLKLILKKGKPVQEVIIGHLDFFRLKNMGFNQTNKYYYYEQLVWRCDFLESLFQILYSNDGLELLKPTFLAQLLNGLVTFLHALAKIGQSQYENEVSLGAKKLTHCSQVYAGCLSFQNDKQISQVDIIYSFIKKIYEHRKDYISKGYQLITRFKSLKIFKSNQLLFLNIYLLKFYLQDGKSGALITIYDEIMKLELSRKNYYLLNDLFNQIKKQFQKVEESYKVMFYGIACLICDYFENQSQLQDYLEHLFTSIKKHNNQYFSKEQNIDLLDMEDSSSIKQKRKSSGSSLFKPETYQFNVKKNSHIVNVDVYLENQFYFIEEEINIKLNVKINRSLLKKGVVLKVFFNNSSIFYETRMNENLQSEQLNFKINPINYLEKDETLYIQKIEVHMKSLNTKWILNKKQITFLKNSKILVYTKIKCPQVSLKIPYNTYYINEISKIKIQVEKFEDYQIDAKFLIKQENHNGKTQLFSDYQERINLINSKYYQDLVNKEYKIHSQFWLKCNQIGEKQLKLSFIIVVQKKIMNKSSGIEKILKKSFTFSKQIRFVIKQLFNLQKIFKEIPSNKQCVNGNIPMNKSILLTFLLESNENILIKEIGHHKNPKNIIYLKQIKGFNILTKKNQKIKFNMVFKLPQELKDQIQLFLTTLYIKWTRTKSIEKELIFENQQKIQNPENLYLDKETTISTIQDKVGVMFTTTDHGIVYKKKISKIIINLQNPSNNKKHIFATCEGNEHIVRVGQKGKGIFLEPKGKISIDFNIIPINSGFLPFPSTKIWVDGTQLKGVEGVSTIKSI